MKKPNTTGQTRYACDSWDADDITVRVKKNGHILRRKVLTKDIVCVNSALLMQDIADALRKGNEVRIGSPENGAAIRLFPCMTADCRKMEVIAQTMGAFRDLLSDKKVHVVHNGEEIGEKTIAKFRREMRENGLQYKANAVERAHVTPDTVVACPRCGFEFRVGRPNKE